MPHHLKNIKLLCLILLSGLISLSAYSQVPTLTGKRLGLYISSKQVTFNEDYHLPISQYLSLEDDRSWSQNVKAELLIRIGEQLSQQLQRANELDSVYFINGDLAMGKQFISVFDAQQNEINPTLYKGELTQLDYILVLNSLTLTSRKDKATYIRSNKIISKPITVFIAQMEVSLFSAKSPTPQHLIETCLDQRNSPKIPITLHFSYRKSQLGNFFSKLFSQMYLQISEEIPSNCEK